MQLGNQLSGGAAAAIMQWPRELCADLGFSPGVGAALVLWESVVLVLACTFPQAGPEACFGAFALPFALAFLAASSKAAPSDATVSAVDAPVEAEKAAIPAEVADLPAVPRSVSAVLGWLVGLVVLVELLATPGIFEVRIVLLGMMLGYILLPARYRRSAPVAVKEPASLPSELPSAANSQVVAPVPAEAATALKLAEETNDSVAQTPSATPPRAAVATPATPAPNSDGLRRLSRNDATHASLPETAMPCVAVEAVSDAAAAVTEAANSDADAVPAQPTAKIADIVNQCKKSKNWADIEEDDERFVAQLATTRVVAKASADDEEDGVVDEAEVAGNDSTGGGAAGRQRNAAQKQRAERQPRQPEQSERVRAICTKGRVGDLSGALEAVEEARASGAPEVEVKNALLFALARAGPESCYEGVTAPELFEEMKVARQANVKSFNIMLRVHLDAGKMSDARALLMQMKEYGVSPNGVTLNELLSDRVRACDAAGMWRCLEEMRSRNCKINKVTCSIVCKAVSKESSKADLHRALALMKELNEPMDEILFTAAVDACVRVNEMNLIGGLLETFHQGRGVADGASDNNEGDVVPACAGGLPSASTYGSVIKALGQAHNVDQIWMAWNMMRRCGVEPSAVTLGCMVEALVTNGAVEDAWTLTCEMAAKEETRPCTNTVIYSTMMKGFAYTQQIDRCFAVFETMRGLGIEANKITYNTLLDACARNQAMSKVPWVFEDMKASQVDPDIITYSTLVKGFCAVGDLDRAFGLFEELKRDGKLQLDEIVYNSLLDGCGKKLQTDRALEVLEEMRASGLRPSNYTLSILVKLLGRAHRLRDALWYVDDFQKGGLKLNVQVYTCLLQACLMNKQVWRALEVHGRMERDGCIPDAKLYSVFLQGCAQQGAYKEVIQIATWAFRCGEDDDSHRASRAPGVEASVIGSLDAKMKWAKLDEADAEAWKRVLDASGRTGGYHGDGCGGGRGAQYGNSGSGAFRRTGNNGGSTAAGERRRSGGNGGEKGSGKGGEKGSGKGGGQHRPQDRQPREQRSYQ